MVRVFVALGLLFALALSLDATERSRATGDVPSIDVVTGGASEDPGPPEPSDLTTDPTVEDTTTTELAAPAHAPTAEIVPAAPPSAPASDIIGSTAHPADVAAFGGELSRAIGAGVPNALGAEVIPSSCHGDGSSPHWGYYNNGAAGGTVFEPDGAIVVVGAVCLNPSQPDPYSSLVHELGHKWFWEGGTWESTASTFGGTERAAECFARIFGATVFGAGGCPDPLVGTMAALLGR